MLCEVLILRDRAHWGLAEDAITASGLQQIAERAAGDARVAIGILRKAARTANQNGQSRIQSSVIADVVLEAKLEIERETINRLTPHQKTLYNIINEAEEINPPTLYEQYSNLVEDPKTERTVRNYLAKLEHYNLIIAEGRAKIQLVQLTYKEGLPSEGPQSRPTPPGIRHAVRGDATRTKSRSRPRWKRDTSAPASYAIGASVVQCSQPAKYGVHRRPKLIRIRRIINQ
ncbi:hypothetical protein ACOZ32_01025 (plasmid) [Halobacterium sp. MBLA0001]|uniref:hypothetical protein n=1 Tax=Halobacterium sp. MBLA0001 TaxID=3413511 RepID=UPI003C718FB6